jgi:membrane fusion protein (multidrug efflux system)
VVVGSWTTWQNSVAVKTDDAYIKADVAPLSTKAVGIVKSASIDDFQSVKAGQILVELKNDEYQARVDQAAELVRQAEIRIADMKQRKEQQDDRVSQARTALADSGKSVSLTDEAITSAQASVQEAKAGIEAAKAAIAQSKAATEAAAADFTRSSLERTRQQALLALESTTKQKVEQTIADNERTMAGVEAAKGAESKARADVSAKQALLSKANQALVSSRVDKAKSLLLVANHQSELSAQIKQRELLDGEEKQLISDLAAKKAALTGAKVDLDYTIIRAPADGIVGELKVKPGQLVGIGTQVITMISAKPWVIANYRETQLSNVREGDSADVTIDAVSGAHLKGHVDRIAPASGAEFSLLPPENASGNFTKIIQRIPVKINFDEDQQRLANLRPGMSAVVTITPGSNR